jgi:hypothetical protein
MRRFVRISPGHRFAEANHFRAIGLKRFSSVKMLRRMSGQPFRIFPEYTCID